VAKRLDERAATRSGDKPRLEKYPAAKLLLVDTGPLVAYFDKSEANHEWAVQELSGRRFARVQTSQAVIAETWHLLGRTRNGRDAVLALIEDGLIEVRFDLEKEAASLRTMIRRYRNVPMSLADASLVRLAEIHRAPVCTLDSDFKIYRLLGRTPLDVICP
jgi:uncharacterized protein